MFRYREDLDEREPPAAISNKDILIRFHLPELDIRSPLGIYGPPLF